MAAIQATRQVAASGAALRQAMELHRGGRLAEAERVYASILADDPDCFEALHFCALLHLQQRRFAQALELVAAALRGRPQSADSLAMMGVLLSNLGRHEDALAVQDRLVALRPASAETHYNRGVSFARLGRHEAAVASYRKALALKSDYAQARHNLGNSLIELGRPQEALDAYDGGAEANADMLTDRGHALRALGRYEEALETYEGATALRPSQYTALIGQGQCLRALGRAEEALSRCDRALAIAPADPDALAAKALALDALERWPQALECLDAVLRSCPDNVSAIGDRCMTLQRLGRFEEALTVAEGLLENDAGNAKAHYHRGNALHALGRYEEAAAAYRQSLVLAPDNASAHKNLGGSFLVLERYEDALDSFERALALGARLQDTLTSRSLVHLSLGQFDRGWSDYRHRFQAEIKAHWRAYSQPLWSGERLAGRLLVWGEQGLGDQILYASMVGELPGRVDEVVFEVEPRLVPLFARSFPGICVIPMRRELHDGPFAAHIPCGSLGEYLRPDWSAFPARPQGFLAADVQRTQALRARLRGDGRRVIGLSWKSVNKKFEKAKTAGLAAFAPLLALPGCRFVDLQYGDTAAERERVARETGITVEHVAEIDNTNDIDGLAALISACDLVVTVSNTTAHLAGGLGKETFVLVPFGQARHWYWFHGRDDNPFYASVQVRRQTAAHDWAGVTGSLAAEIAGLPVSEPARAGFG